VEEKMDARASLMTALAAVVICAGSAACADSFERDAAEIKNLEAAYVSAIRKKNLDRLMDVYERSPKLFVFDLVPPRQYVGWDAYRADWQGVLDGCKDAPALEMSDLAVEGDGRYAWGHNIQHMSCTTPSGAKLDMTYRVTDVYRKIGGKWLIVHEHISVPVDLQTGKADLSSKP
jgi:ketosteroid isomerase-like protein